MTSNQINASIAREEARHNAQTEQLEKRKQSEIEKQNKRNTLLQAAGIINQSAQTINDSVNSSYQNELRSQSNQISAYGTYSEAEYKRTMADINTKQQKEQERYNRVSNALTLRNIQHLEYQDQLQALRDNWQRQVDNVNATYQNADITIRSAANTINSYLAQIERANVNVSAWKAYVDAMVKEYDMALKEAQTEEARSRVVTNYINATTNVLTGITNGINNLLKLPF